MKYIKENKDLLLKYVMIIISNILIFILSNYYLKVFGDYSSIIMFILIVIDGMIICYYKGTKKFKVYLDIICCFSIGLLMLLFVKDAVFYSYYIFNLFFANNIVFIQTRKSDKFFIRALQYMSIILITILCMFLNLLVYYFIYGM